MWRVGFPKGVCFKTDQILELKWILVSEKDLK